MKVSRISVVEYAMPIAGLGVEAGGAAAVTNICADPSAELKVAKFAIIIETDDGARGEYAAQWGGTRAVLGQALMMAPFLLGRDPLQRELIFDDLKREFRQYDHMAHGLFDIALWDLAGKAQGASVATMLGGWRTKLPTYASTYHAQRGSHGLHDIGAFVEFARQCKAMGYPAFKVHGWHDGDVRREGANLRAIRAAIGDEMGLMIDPACEIRTFADALALGLVCDEVGCLWYEDPFRDAGTSAFAAKRLRERLKTPLLMTEHVRGIEPKADFVLAGGTDILRADPEYDLGITGCMKIAHLAEALGLDVEIHAVGPAHRHCMAAIRNTRFYELALVGPGMPNALPEVYLGYSDQLDAVDAEGCVPVPAGPGLGVTIDWEKIDAHRTAFYEFTP
jgi:L-alanine-DL-glutamate epimerase-like enolase superfamily enzyme